MNVEKLNRFAAFIVLALTVWACAAQDGESTAAMTKPEATLAGACTAVCHKLDDCDALNGATVDDCIRGCSREEAAAVSGGADGCPITSLQANTCISAIGELSCPVLSRGDFPAACSFCDDTASRAKSAAAGSGGPGCADLHLCCDQISAAEQQSFCNMVVHMNNPGLCAAVLPSYRSADQCR